MEKKIIKKEIFSKTYEGEILGVNFSDIPKGLLDDDLICINFNEGHYSENNSYDSHTELVVLRDTLETDEEFEKRKNRAEKEKENSRKMRYESYLKLKKEFE